MKTKHKRFWIAKVPQCLCRYKGTLTTGLRMAPGLLIGDAPSHNDQFTKQYMSNGIAKVSVTLEEHVEGLFRGSERLMSRCGKEHPLQGGLQGSWLLAAGCG